MSGNSKELITLSTLPFIPTSFSPDFIFSSHFEDKVSYKKILSGWQIFKNKLQSATFVAFRSMYCKGVQGGSLTIVTYDEYELFASLSGTNKPISGLVGRYSRKFDFRISLSWLFFPLCSHGKV